MATGVQRKSGECGFWEAKGRGEGGVRDRWYRMLLIGDQDCCVSVRFREDEAVVYLAREAAEERAGARREWVEE